MNAFYLYGYFNFMTGVYPQQQRTKIEEFFLIITLNA